VARKPGSTPTAQSPTSITIDPRSGKAASMKPVSPRSSSNGTACRSASPGMALRLWDGGGHGSAAGRAGGCGVLPPILCNTPASSLRRW